MPIFKAKSDWIRLNAIQFIASNRRKIWFQSYCIRAAAEGSHKKKHLASTFFQLPIETMENKLGRPTSYTKDKADEICKMLADGITLQTICTLPEMPDRQTVHNWMKSHPDFFDAYTYARQLQADTFAEMVLSEAFNSHDAQIGRLRIDALKWTASKLAPKKYGDKIEVESNSQQNFKISFSVPDRNTQDSLQDLQALPEAAPQIIDIQPEAVESE